MIINLLRTSNTANRQIIHLNHNISGYQTHTLSELSWQLLVLQCLDWNSWKSCLHNIYSPDRQFSLNHDHPSSSQHGRITANNSFWLLNCQKLQYLPFYNGTAPVVIRAAALTLLLQQKQYKPHDGATKLQHMCRHLLEYHRELAETAFTLTVLWINITHRFMVVQAFSATLSMFCEVF